MKVISVTGKAKLRLKKPVLAIGIFDGIHRGHQLLIRKTIAKAKATHGTSVVMTFSPHPVHVLAPHIKLPYLISLPYRLKLMERMGVDVCIVVNFTKKFSRLTPSQFIEDFLVKKIDPKEILVGENFRFGQHRSGDPAFLKKEGEHLGFRVNVVKSVAGSGGVVSSTRIRKAIAAGQLDLAARMLGRRVSLMGKVVRGDARGKKLGYPTANIKLSSEVLPPRGVYLVKAMVKGKSYHGLANLGIRPTFRTKNPTTHLEVYILDFHKTLYGQNIIIEFIKKIRDEKKFPSQEKLVLQLRSDEQKARNFFRNISS